MFPTTYHRPRTLAEAARLLADNDEAMLVSGGHTLLPTMKQRLAAPSHLIDLRHVPDLAGIVRREDTLTIGAASTHAEVARHPAVIDAIPALAGLAGSIADPMVRNRGTIGGSVANNDPAADYPSAVLALAATVCTDRRRIDADSFFAGLYATALEPGEIVTAVSFPVPRVASYAKFRNPASRYPMAGVFVACHADGHVRVAVTGAGSGGVFRVDAMEAALEGDYTADALAAIAIDPGGMMGDLHGSSDYRANLVSVLARRAVAGPGTAQVFT